MDPVHSLKPDFPVAERIHFFALRNRLKLQGYRLLLARERLIVQGT